MSDRDYQLDDDVTERVQHRSPAALVISVRVPGEMAERLQRAATIRDLTLSEIARDALTLWMEDAYLPRGMTGTTSSGALLTFRSRPGQETYGAPVALWPVPTDMAAPDTPDTETPAT